MIPADKIAHIVFQPDPVLVERIEAKLIASYGFDVVEPRDKQRASGIPGCERGLVFKAGLLAGTVIRKHLRNFLATRTGTFVHELIQKAGWGDEAIAEETIENDWLRGHSDHRFVKDGLLVDYKTAFVDDWFDVAVGCRPQKADHVVQSVWYAVMHGCERVALVYFNRNLKLSEHLRRSPEWRAHVERFPGASETLAAVAFKADVALARAADRKAKRILDHVRAGTLPKYDPLPEQLVPYKGECHFCEVRQLCHDDRDRPNSAPVTSTVENEDPEPPAEPGEMAIERWTNLMVEGKKTVRLAWQTWPSKIVGTTHRDQIPWNRLKVGDRLELEWDHQNPNGPRFLDNRAQAIKAVHAPTGAFLGFLPATKSATAGRVCWHLAHLGLTHGRGGEAFATIAELTGGTPEKVNRGINIRITLCAPDGAVPPEDLPAPSSPARAGH
jgi:hypothetical protein